MILGHILHDWDDPVKLMLLEKAFKSLNTDRDTYCLVFDYFLNDERNNLPALMMSMHMQMCCRGSQFTYKQCEDWMAKFGFTEFKRVRLSGYIDALIGVKKKI